MADGRILTVGSAATDLDIFITAGQNGAPIDPSGITFRIFDPTNALAVNTTSGTKVEVGRYNASAAIIPPGFVLGESWEIRWDVILPGGASGQFVEQFSVTTPTLSATFANPEANNVESLFDRVRVDLGDIDAMIFTDGLLRRTIKKAVSRVNRRLGLVRVCEDNEFLWMITFMSSNHAPTLTLDLYNGTISPSTDPYADILVLQMEEILATSEAFALQRLNATTAGVFGSGLVGVASDGVSVTNADNVSISKAVGRLAHRADLAKFNIQNIRTELEQAIKDMRWRLSGCAGRDVTIPRFGNLRYGRFI